MSNQKFVVPFKHTIADSHDVIYS